MIAYEKKNKKAKKRFILSLGCLILLVSGIFVYDFMRPKTEPVFYEFPILQLPDTTKLDEKPIEEKPFSSAVKIISSGKWAPSQKDV